MILYLGTSDLFKLYVREPDSNRVDENVLSAERLASSRFAYVEMRSALAKANRDNRIPMSAGAAAYSDLVKRFRSDWRSFAKIAVTGSLLELAGEVAEQHGLRAGDALHLASALLLRGQIEEEVEFSVSDGQLRTGAVSEGFVVI